jgi:hypothetical protein
MLEQYPYIFFHFKGVNLEYSMTVMFFVTLNFVALRLFGEDTWTCPGGGGGKSSVLQGGYVFEKAAMIQHHCPPRRIPSRGLRPWRWPKRSDRYHI